MQIIRKNVFKGCKSLSSISLPASAISVDDGAFQGCTSLTGVSLGKNVKHIGTSAFTDDAKLISVDRLNNTGLTGDTFDIVGNCAFKNTGLTAANLALRSSAIQTFWGDECFAGCKALKDANFMSANYMARDMFKGCTSLTGVSFKNDQMAYTYPGIFKNCTSLRDITLPGKLLFMPDYEFEGCSKLENVDFTVNDSESTIDEIQREVFKGCSKLQDVVIPASIDDPDKIDPEALKDSKLTSIEFKGLRKDQISRTVPFQFPALPMKFYMNRVYSLSSEPYYALFNTWQDFKASRLGSLDTTITENDFNKYKDVCEQNYQTIASLVAYTKANQYELNIVVGLKHHENGTPIILSTDVVSLAHERDVTGKLLAELPYPLGASINQENSMLDACIRYAKTNASKKLHKNCDYFIDDIMLQAYLQPNSKLPVADNARKYYQLFNGTWTSISYKKFAEKSLEKQQRGGFFIFYNLDIGNFSGDDIKNEKSLATAIALRIKYLVDLDNTPMKRSGFHAISKYMFNTKEIDVVINERLLDFKNYCMTLYRKVNNFNNVYSISIPNKFEQLTSIEDYNAKQKQEESEINNLKADNTFIDYYSLKGLSFYTQCLRHINTYLNGTLITLDTNFVDEKTGYVLSNRVYNQANYTDSVLSSGFFGLKSNINVKCYDSPEPIAFDYDSIKDFYVKPNRDFAAVDKSTTDGFNTSTWYYNAKELYDYVRKNSQPCLFIYSLYGCGPCAVFQKQMWPNKGFQDWFKKQKFYHCMLECEQQPMYDKQLQFCVDQLSPYAANFAKEDLGELSANKSSNVFGKIYRRYVAGNSTAQTLMTPVLVFMDKNGTRYDYTYHDIAADIGKYGVDGMVQQLKSLCLYHFDQNNMDSAKYVVDAGKAFDKADYSIPSDNPWYVSENTIDLSKNINKLNYIGINTLFALPQQIYDYLQDCEAKKKAKVEQGIIYLGGCLFDEIPWIKATYKDLGEIAPDADDTSTDKTEEELEQARAQSQARNLTAACKDVRIKIDNSYYVMSFDETDIVTAATPCSPPIPVFRVNFSPA